MSGRCKLILCLGPLRLNSTNRIISASRTAPWEWNVCLTNISDLPCQKRKYSSPPAAPLLQHRWSYAMVDMEECCSQSRWPLGEILHTPEKWLTSELVAVADERQTPFQAVPTSSLSTCTTLFWDRAACQFLLFLKVYQVSIVRLCSGLSMLILLNELKS